MLDNYRSIVTDRDIKTECEEMSLKDLKEYIINNRRSNMHFVLYIPKELRDMITENIFNEYFAEFNITDLVLKLSKPRSPDVPKPGFVSISSGERSSFITFTVR